MITMSDLFKEFYAGRMEDLFFPNIEDILSNTLMYESYMEGVQENEFILNYKTTGEEELD